MTVCIVYCSYRTRHQLLFVLLRTPVGTHMHSTAIKHLSSLWDYRPVLGFVSRYAHGKDSLRFTCYFFFWQRILVWQSVNKRWSVTSSTHWILNISRLFQVTEEGHNTSSRSTRPWYATKHQTPMAWRSYHWPQLFSYTGIDCGWDRFLEKQGEDKIIWVFLDRMLYMSMLSANQRRASAKATMSVCTDPLVGKPWPPGQIQSPFLFL